MSDGWISSTQFALLAGISRQVSNRTLKQFNEGRRSPWRGSVLTVVSLTGQKAAAGKAYRVAIASLPFLLQERLKSLAWPAQEELDLARPSKGGGEVAWWLHQLRPILDLDPGSVERAEAIDRLIGTAPLDWNMRPRRLTRSTVYRKLAELDGPTGLAALKKKQRSDIGRDKYFISRAWDQAVPFESEVRRKIATNLQSKIRALRAQRTSRKIVLLLAAKWLKEDTAAHGYRERSAGDLDRICRVPIKLYTREAAYQAVYDLNKDRDRFDNQSPRIKRSIAGMSPMEMVVADVHPIDIRIERSDGTVGSAKLIAFMDIATRRVWADVLMVEKDGGVRNTDVIQSFVAMASDPAWGSPQTLYCDNGSEYRFADFLDDALKLAGPRLVDASRLSRVVRALPYNASAKPIEAWFNRIEKDHLRHLQGWHGGKLGSPKRPARGKLPAPFSAGFDAFCDVIKAHVAAYHAIPQGGELKGKSPNATLQKHIDSGWAATVLNASELYTVFSRPETRVVQQHGISVDGRKWNCPELDAYFKRTVTVRIPVLGFGFNELWVGNDKGEFLGFAVPDVARPYNDTRQARHSADRKKTTVAGVRALERDLPRIDTDAEIRALASIEPAPVPHQPNGVISVGSGRAGERAIVPTHTPAKSRAEAEAKQRALNEFLISTSLRRNIS